MMNFTVTVNFIQLLERYVGEFIACSFPCKEPTLIKLGRIQRERLEKCCGIRHPEKFYEIPIEYVENEYYLELL